MGMCKETGLCGGCVEGDRSVQLVYMEVGLCSGSV